MTDEEDLSSTIFNDSFTGFIENESGSSGSSNIEVSSTPSEVSSPGGPKETKDKPIVSINGVIASLEISSDADSLSSSSQEEEWQEMPSSSDLPPEYWQVQRIIKYIKAGNPTATIISLSTLKDFDLDDRCIQLGIRDSGGLEVLVNILETDESRCKRAALAIIRIISKSSGIVRAIYNMQGLETLVQCLADPCKEVKILTAETIANICRIGKARKAMGKNDGIPRLVAMLDIRSQMKSDRADTRHEDINLEMARTGATALWSLAKSKKNREFIQKAGAIPFLAKMMKTTDMDVIIPTVGILQECASEPTFRIAIYSVGLLSNFVEGLRSTNKELIQYCAMALSMCAEDLVGRKNIHELKGIEPIMEIIQIPIMRQNKKLLAAATGIISKCAATIFKIKKFTDRGIIELLISMLDGEGEDILINISEIIEELVKIDISFAGVVMRSSGIPLLIKALTIENEELLVNTTRAIGVLATDVEARLEMERLDGFRLIWSLLKHPSARVQACAAWAICPYVESSNASNEMVRNYVGGLEALVELLLSEYVEVQSAVCEAIATIAASPVNLAIMSDQNVVQYLTRIVLAQQRIQGNDLLKCGLAKAIAGCCTWGQNSKEFGELQAVKPICQYLSSKNNDVVREAATALSALSRDPRNCITIHQSGVARRLIRLAGSRDEELRQAAAGVMSNIRILALTTEKIRFCQKTTRATP